MFVALVVLLGLFSFVKGQRTKSNHPAIKSINVGQLKEKISKEKSIQFVDVRTDREYRSGYIKPAVNIDFMAKDFIDKFNSYNKEEPLYLYCRSGNRSGKAAVVLAKKGFTEIYDLQGGILLWNKQSK